MILAIGDRVSLARRRTKIRYDGTVVDVIDSRGDPPVVRVYWRYPAGRVIDYPVTDLVRVV